MKKLVHEVHRRSLWQVLGIYLVLGWVVLQVVDVLAQNMGLPEWVFPFAIVLLVIGLPVVLATAFVQVGVGSNSLSGDAPADSPPQTPDGLLTWRNAIGGGVAAFALWGVVAAGWMLFGPGRGPSSAEAADLRSVAALPFSTVHTDEESLAFVAGIHDDLLTQLSKIDSLKVISRTSVMQYEGTTKTIPEIAAELGVATILEGGVQKAGDRVRVNVQLIDAENDEHLWAETYDQQLTAANVFAIQSDLAKKIAVALRATLTPEVRQRIEAQPTENLAAYDYYTRGRYLLESGRTGNRQGLEAAAELFRQSIAADSGYAPAWASLADVYTRQWNWMYVSPAEAEASGTQAVERALELDPDLAEAHLVLGQLLLSQGSYEEAERATLRALELNPGSGYAHGQYGLLLQLLGRIDESVVEGRRAVELDPLSITNRHRLADRLFFSRDYEGSIAETEKVIELEPTDWYAWYNLGWCYSMTGRDQKAEDAFLKAREFNPDDPTVDLGLAYAYARNGRRESALDLIEGVDEDSYDVSLVYYELGDEDEAFARLESVLAADPGQLARLKTDPSGDALRRDSRFAEILGKLNLD